MKDDINPRGKSQNEWVTDEQSMERWEGGEGAQEETVESGKQIGGSKMNKHYAWSR